ncbi:titin isoform X3 [Hippocampus zosterae]|uniref:titin isoform X3 n=1 Tax=Hippocampus zosterae TaxID=109293 RepID=UPI00223CE0FE|nr:titin isoform X3 [Hippocampus zosterae]
MQKREYMLTSWFAPIPFRFTVTGSQPQLNVLIDSGVTSMLMDIVPTSAPPNENKTIYVTSMFRNIFPTSEASTETQTVYEPPVPSLQLQSNWWDVFPFEKADFVCSVNSSSDWSFIWYRNGQRLHDVDQNVSSNLSNQAALTITAESQAESGMYSCKAHHEVKGESILSNRIELKVYANKPKPMLVLNPKLQKMFPGESVTFQCVMDVPSGWHYMWYHNDKQIPGSLENSFRIISLTVSDSGRYHCKAKRGQNPFYTEQSETSMLEVSEPPTPTVKLRTSWSDVFQMESVELTCDVVRPNWTVTWHRNGVALQEDPALVLSFGGTLLNITCASRAHGGRYACKAHLKFRGVSSDFSNTTSVTVYENIPKPSLSKYPVVTLMYVGETVTFTCKVDVGSGWVYHWFKDEKKLVATDKTLRIKLSPHDGGIYWCKATRGQRTATDISDRMTQEVLEIPLPSLTRKSQWADVFPTESVTLSCTMVNSSGWTYMWHRDNRVIPSDDAVSFGPDGATLSIHSASTSHKGQYCCWGKLKDRAVSSNCTSGMTLMVYDNKPIAKLGQDPEDVVMHSGDSVSYSCHINQSSGWEYVWYQDDTRLTVSGNNYTIPSVDKTNTGSYKCEAVRGRTTSIFKTEQSQALRLQVEERPSANIMVLTGWSEVFSTDSLVLMCEVKGSEEMWTFKWFKEGQWIMNSSSDKYTVTPQNDPAQSQYICQGIHSGRPSYSQRSDALATKNLLLKRRVLLSISGCILFGIIAVFFGCVVLRVTRRKDHDEGPEEAELFLTMAQLKDRDDAPCPLVDYITDEKLNDLAKEGADVCSEETPLPVTSPDDQVVTTESCEKPPSEEGALVSFQH